MNKSDKLYCETHKCTISVSGCIKRQDRHNTHAPYMYNLVALDPACADCKQGKAVKKGKYTIYKEKAMNVKAELEKLETLAKGGNPTPLVERAKTEPMAQKKGPDRPPKQEQTPEKKCSICGDVFPATKKHFRGHSATADGLENRCKNCVGKNPVLQVDFSERSALLEKLENLAFADYRTPELQIMALIEKEATNG